MTIAKPIWLPEFPSNWDLIPLKRLCTIETGTADTQDADPDGSYDFVIRSPRLKHASTYTFDCEAIVTAGDGAVGEVFHYMNGPFLAHQRTYVLHSFQGIDARYLFYLFSSHFRFMCQDGSAKTTVDSVRRWMLTDMPILVPPENIQKRIAQFLDTETAKIDHVVAKQRELISLSEDRLSAFIENALMKGIPHDNTSPMEWRRVKHLFKLRDERNHLEREEVTLLSLYAKHGVRKYDEIEERTGNPVRTVQDYKCVHAGDIIVNIILAWMGSIGRSPHNGVISPAYDIWTPLEEVSSRYYHYLFRTKWFSGECYKRGKGIMMMRWRTYADQFGDINVPFPTRQEQDYLVTLIEREESQVQNLISKCQRMIDLLQERRSTLITAAVTGQIEV